MEIALCGAISTVSDITSDLFVWPLHPFIIVYYYM